MNTTNKNYLDQFIARSYDFIGHDIAFQQAISLTHSSSELEDNAVDTEKYLTISEAVILNQKESQNQYDYLLIIGCNWNNHEQTQYPPLMVILPETFRSFSNTGSPSVLINDIPLSQYVYCESMAIMLCRIDRGFRTNRILESIKSLVRTLDFNQNYRPSLSIADAIFDQIELIVESQYTETVLRGKFLLGDLLDSDKDNHYFVLIDNKNEQPNYWVHKGQLRRGTTEDSLQPLLNENYILFRIGSRSSQVDVKKYIDDLRQRHVARSEVDQGSNSQSYRSYIKQEQERRKERILSELYGHHNMLSLVTPIAIEASSDLLLLFESTGQVGSPIQDSFDRVRNNLLEILGVRISGIRTRLNAGDLPPNSYIIMLNEVPLVMDYVSIDLGLTDASWHQLQQLSVVEEQVVDWQSSSELIQDKLWIRKDDWDTIRQAGYTVWEPEEIVGFHLEAVLRENLRNFVGIQEVADTLEEFDLLPQIQQAHGGLARFVNVCTTLVDEELPIKPISQLVEIYLEIIDAPAFEIGERLRSIEEIRTQLLPNTEDTEFLALGKDIAQVLLENTIQEGDNAALALEPAITQDILSVVRSAINAQFSYSTKTVILVDDWVIRPLFKKLIELEHPTVKVLTRHEIELINPTQIISARTITLVRPRYLRKRRFNSNE